MMFNASLSNKQNCGFCCFISSMFQMDWKVLTIVDVSLFGMGGKIVALELSSMHQIYI